jgi:hypothetical protein
MRDISGFISWQLVMKSECAQGKKITKKKKKKKKNGTKTFFSSYSQISKGGGFGYGKTVFEKDQH